MPNTDSLKQEHIPDVFYKTKYVIQIIDMWGGPQPDRILICLSKRLSNVKITQRLPPGKERNYVGGKYKPHTHRNKIKGVFYLFGIVLLKSCRV